MLLAKSMPEFLYGIGARQKRWNMKIIKKRQDSWRVSRKCQTRENACKPKTDSPCPRERQKANPYQSHADRRTVETLDSIRHFRTPKKTLDTLFGYLDTFGSYVTQLSGTHHMKWFEKVPDWVRGIIGLAAFFLISYFLSVAYSKFQVLWVCLWLSIPVAAYVVGTGRLDDHLTEKGMKSLHVWLMVFAVAMSIVFFRTTT